MSIWSSISKLVKEIDPWLETAGVLTLIATRFGIIRSSFHKTKDANGKEVFSSVGDPEATMIANAPALFKNHEHEVLFTMLMSLMRDKAVEKQVMEVWMPRLCENQNADVLIRGAMLYKAGPHGQQAALRVLKNIGTMQHADPDALQKRRTTYADAYNWLRDPEDEYFIVKVKKASGFATLTTIAAFNEIVNRVNAGLYSINNTRANSSFSRRADKYFGRP